jgi:hypothetical protein
MLMDFDDSLIKYTCFFNVNPAVDESVPDFTIKGNSIISSWISIIF